MRRLSFGIFYWQRETVSSRIEKVLARISRGKIIYTSHAKYVARRIANELSGNPDATLRAIALDSCYCDEGAKFKDGKCLGCILRQANVAPFSEVSRCSMCKRTAQKDSKGGVEFRYKAIYWNSDVYRYGDFDYDPNHKDSGMLCCECYPKALKIRRNLKVVAENFLLINKLNKEITNATKHKNRRAVA